MANISGESQASFRRMLLCATIGIAVIVSPCFAHEDRSASQEIQADPPGKAQEPFTCDSLVPGSVSISIDAEGNRYQHP
jgi:hypothetical protein